MDYKVKINGKEYTLPVAFPDLETADVNMILKACMDIVNVYAAPSLEMLQGVLNNPDMKKAVELAKLNQ